MATRNQVNREPRGFLSLFLAKVGGQTPRTIREEIQPVVEISPFTRASLLRGQLDTASGAPPANVSILIPDRELWWIHSISLTMVTAAVAVAAESAVCQLRLLNIDDDNGNLVDIELGSAFLNQDASSEHSGSSFTYVPRGLILPGGASIQGLQKVSDFTSNFTNTVSVLYSKLEV